jgi:hypothetical protein
MRVVAAVALVAWAGCTSVRVAQRGDCWVRRTSGFLQGSKEEVGPCAPPAPQWSSDRPTRVVQECVARADWQWHSRAVVAWTRGEALPEQDQEKVGQACMQESTRLLASEHDADALRGRVAELSKEREELHARAEADRRHLAAANDRMAEHLGEAAKKPSPPAVATATATSEGRGGGAENAAPPVTVVGSPPVNVTGPPVSVTTAPPVNVTAPPVHVTAGVAPPACEAEPAPRAPARGQARATPPRAKRAPPNCVPIPAAAPVAAAPVPAAANGRVEATRAEGAVAPASAADPALP